MGRVKDDMNFSVAMSIYKNDVPEYLSMALESIYNQTLNPAEIVIVGDGPIPDELSNVVRLHKENAEKKGVMIRFLPQKVNRGLGGALRVACENCQYDYIARMDSDDISMPDRFEKQMKCFSEDPSLSLVGGMITEFVGDMENIVSKRILPLDNEHIYKMMQTRCGVNHVTVIIKKEDLMLAGNYSSELRQEDFYLWARMMKHGAKFRNIPDVVVNVRSGVDQFARRGGLKYYRQHMKVFKYMYHEGLISLPILLKNYILRLLQVLLPKHLRTWTYQKYLRN